ncbi:MAG: hypothetical protein WA063_02830 [Minisyncoccia bacterium]
MGFEEKLGNNENNKPEKSWAEQEMEDSKKRRESEEGKRGAQAMEEIHERWEKLKEKEEEESRMGEKVDLLKEFTDAGRSKLLEDNLKKIEDCKKRLESPEGKMIDSVANIVKIKMAEYEEENRILTAIKEGKL